MSSCARIKLGETDRIVSILARGHGKIRAVAKGVRKTGSRFGARLEPTTHVAFQCYRGRSELDVVTQVETIDSNRALREHYGCLTHAVSMLEAVDQVAQDREPNAAALPDARRRAAHAGGRAQPARERRRSSGSCSPSRGSIRCSTAARGAATSPTPFPAFDLAGRRRALRDVREPARTAPRHPRRWRCSVRSWAASCGPRSPSHPVRPRSTSSAWRSPPSSTTSNVVCAAARCCSHGASPQPVRMRKRLPATIVFPYGQGRPDGPRRQPGEASRASSSRPARSTAASGPPGTTGRSACCSSAT